MSGGDYIPFPFSEEDAFFDLLKEPGPDSAAAEQEADEVAVEASGLSIALWLSLSTAVGLGLGAAGYVLGLGA